VGSGFKSRGVYESPEILHDFRAFCSPCEKGWWSLGNPVVHFELIGPDPAELRRFYAALFGWVGVAGAPVASAISSVDSYSFVEPDAGAAPAAGGIGGGPGYSARAVFYVGVDDVRDTLDRVLQLGGSVVLEPQRNGGGEVLVAHFTDPAGNLVGIAGPA
jgi:predicted enzyme related to lactoylglutathione lyase